MRLILLGPPSAGKGTQAAMLSQRFGLLHLATGDLLRDAVAAGTSLGRKAKKFMDTGALVPDAIVLGLLEGKMKSTNSQAGFILDGFPRSIEQAERLNEITDIDLVLCIDVDYDKLRERATGRRVCRKCGAVYHIRYNPPKVPNICDRDGGALYQRDDDREEVVRKRLRTYEEQTRPVINYYQTTGKLKFVDGDASIEEVGKRLLDAIFEQWPQLKDAGAPSGAKISVPGARAQPISAPGAQPAKAGAGQTSHGSRRHRGKGRRGKSHGRYFKKFQQKGKG
ncbi:MAG: adenylate kinase [Thermoplasmata archaeon]